MKYISFLSACLLAFGLLMPQTTSAQIQLAISPTSSGTYSAGQSLTITVTSANTAVTYSIDAFESSTATTPMTAVTIANAQGGGKTFSGQTEAIFLVRFLAGSEGEGRILKIAGTDPNGDDQTQSGELTIIPAPVITLTPSTANYAEGQSVTATMTGGLAGQEYIIKLYNSLPPGFTNDVSGEITPSTSQNTVNTITWSDNQTSAEFYIRLDQRTLGSSRYLVVTNLDFSHIGVSAPFTVCPPAGSTQALASDVLVPTPLGPNNCSVLVNTQAQGNSFVFTGPDGYVFSNVFRNAGTYPVSAPITKPGTYQLTITYDDYCGKSTATKSFTVTGEACK